MTPEQIEIPEEIASRTIEAIAQWIDQRARESLDHDEQERLGSLAEALRFDGVAIIKSVTMGED